MPEKYNSNKQQGEKFKGNVKWDGGVGGDYIGRMNLI